MIRKILGQTRLPNRGAGYIRPASCQERSKNTSAWNYMKNHKSFLWIDGWIYYNIIMASFLGEFGLKNFGGGRQKGRELNLQGEFKPWRKLWTSTSSCMGGGTTVHSFLHFKIMSIKNFQPLYIDIHCHFSRFFRDFIFNDSSLVKPTSLEGARIWTNFGTKKHCRKQYQ